MYSLKRYILIPQPSTTAQPHRQINNCILSAIDKLKEQYNTVIFHVLYGWK